MSLTVPGPESGSFSVTVSGYWLMTRRRKKEDFYLFLSHNWKKVYWPQHAFKGRNIFPFGYLNLAFTGNRFGLWHEIFLSNFSCFWHR